MKRAFLVPLFLLLLLLAGQVNASYWFKVIDISPINLTPNSESNFTVAVKGLGSKGAYVELVFKNKSQGIDTSCEKMIKYVFPAGVTRYNCTVKAEDVAPGNYSFVVDVSAKGAPSGKKTAYIEVVGAEAGRSIDHPSNRAPPEGMPQSMQKNEGANANQMPTEPQAKGIPSPGFAMASLVMLSAFWRMR
jgi:hypothetical protein